MNPTRSKAIKSGGGRINEHADGRNRSGSHIGISRVDLEIKVSYFAVTVT